MTSVDIVVHGRRVDVSSRFREQASEKLARMERFGVALKRIDAELSKENNPRLVDRAFKVELTCRGSGPVIRAEAAEADKYTALDKAVHRLEEQLRRAHDRARFHRNGRSAKRIELPGEFPDGEILAEQSNGSASTSAVDQDNDVPDDEVYAVGPVVVRHKTHSTEPMTVEQAVTEMEMVGHDFFLFHEVDSRGPAVVYRRQAYDYGLIRIETATVIVNEG